MTDSHNEDRSELLQGTLEMLVLKMLAHEPMHGWGMSQRIQQMSREVILVSQGTLYPALQRMKRRGWIKSSWQITENNRRARYYELTATGRKQLVVEQASWERAFTAVNWIMQTPIAGGAT
ncbi:MAG: PadR family transcriptional regulator [Gemmatimonadaceae bacterium]